MLPLFDRIKIFSSFWFILGCYFTIPYFVYSVDTPNWFYYIDSMIPFISWMIIPYYIYYLVVLLPPFIWTNEWKIRNITAILNFLSIICYIIFILWPIDASHILRQALVKEDSVLFFFHNLITYDFLHQNAFPSMHVVVSSFLCLCYYHDFKKFRLAAILIAFFIFLATFLIKQHYFFDSIIGLLIGFFGYCYYIFRLKSYK